ncbi:hypothetical protein Tsp_11793 [Trichinella spiralis]|uniref:hypothetical protein n=1 Tax=Trichinella spiralis TaxID=6334 RepID=UPI0001EFEC37|nr:hypothetical protein Tsp_11793 [Trichinella spiralis]
MHATDANPIISALITLPDGGVSCQKASSETTFIFFNPLSHTFTLSDFYAKICCIPIRRAHFHFRPTRPPQVRTFPRFTSTLDPFSYCSCCRLPAVLQDWDIFVEKGNSTNL